MNDWTRDERQWPVSPLQAEQALAELNLELKSELQRERIAICSCSKGGDARWYAHANGCAVYTTGKSEHP